MAQQEGPFSEYLQQAKLAPPMEVPKPTGLEGTGAAIGNIAMNFINGLRQGRMQKQAMQHLEEQKKYDAYQHAIQTVAASGLPDRDKKLLSAQLSVPLIQRIAGDKEATSKHTGNPLTDVVKHMAIGLVGGPGPKKMDLPMEPVVAALQAASDPERSADRIASRYESQIRDRVNEILKNNPYAESRDILGDQVISGIHKEAEGALGKFASPFLANTLKELPALTPAQRNQIRIMKLFEPKPEKTASPTIGAEGAPVVAPEAAAKPTATAQAGVPAPTAQPPVQSATGGQFVPQKRIDEIATLAQTGGMPQLYKEEGGPEEYQTPAGDRVTGKYIRFNDYGTLKSGVYDYSTQTLYPLSSLKKLKSGEGTTKDIESAYSDAAKSIKADLEKEDPRIIQSFQSELDSAKNRNDLASIKQARSNASKFIRDKWTREQQDIQREKRAASGDARREAAADQRLFFKQTEALNKAYTQYLSSKPHQVFSKMDTQYRSFINEDLAQGINVDAYLRNPAEYMKNIKNPQEHLSLMDKSLQRLAAKITDEGSVVRPLEEEGYGKELSGPLTRLKAAASALFGAGSTKATPGARAELWKLIKSFHAEIKRTDEIEKQQRKQSISGWQIDPEKIDKTFSDIAATTQPPAPGAGGGRIPPRDEGAIRGGGKGEAERKAPTL